eukprot:1400030-Rhodomonas_salina.1
MHGKIDERDPSRYPDGHARARTRTVSNLRGLATLRSSVISSSDSRGVQVPGSGIRGPGPGGSQLEAPEPSQHFLLQSGVTVGA